MGRGWFFTVVAFLDVGSWHSFRYHSQGLGQTLEEYKKQANIDGSNTNFCNMKTLDDLNNHSLWANLSSVLGVYKRHI